MNPELIAAVKERLALGHTPEMVKEELKQAGYDEGVIDHIIQEAQVATIPSPVPAGRAVLPEVGELLSVGWSFTKRYSVLVVLLSLPLLALLIPAYFFGKGMTGETADLAFFGTIAGIIMYVVYFLLIAAVLRIAVLDDGSRAIPLKEVWGWVKTNVSGLLWVFVLSAFVVWGGLVLFVIPGIIVAILIYLSQYVYAVEGVRGMNALLRSRELVQGYWGALAGRVVLVGLVFMGILIGFGIVIGIIAAAVGMDTWENSVWELAMNLIGQVVSAVATLVSIKIGAELYRALSFVKPATAVVTTEARGKYVTLAWLGFFAPILFIVLFASVFVSSIGLLGDAIEQQSMSDHEAKMRALEMRGDLDVDSVEEGMRSEEF